MAVAWRHETKKIYVHNKANRINKSLHIKTKDKGHER